MARRARDRSGAGVNGTKLREYREQRGLSQAEVARRMRISKQLLGQIERREQVDADVVGSFFSAVHEQPIIVRHVWLLTDPHWQELASITKRARYSQVETRDVHVARLKSGAVPQEGEA